MSEGLLPKLRNLSMKHSMHVQNNLYMTEFITRKLMTCLNKRLNDLRSIDMVLQPRLDSKSDGEAI